jgi:histidinol-phosphate aminotransferase
VLVRHFAKPRISDYLRISVGSDWENGRLLQALTEILAA